MNALTNSSIRNGFDAVFSEVDSTKKLNLKNNNCLRLFCPSKSVCKEAAEIKYNIPELFVEA